MDIGSWGLFCGPEARQLVLVGEAPCGPVSARKIMRTVPRRALLDEGRVAAVFRGGQEILELANIGGEEWTCAVRPIRAPGSGTIIGVLGIVVPAGSAVPPSPLVGAWEWQIERDERGMPTAHRRNHWDENLRKLYAVDPEVVQQHRGAWEAGGAMTELIAPADQMRLNASIRDALLDTLAGIAGRFKCLTYTIVTGFGEQQQGQRHLRLVGTMLPLEPSDEHIVLQGFSYGVPDSFHEATMGRDARVGQVDQVLRGVMEMAQQPMAVVDATTLDVLMTSSSWRRAGFGHVGGLGDVVIDKAEALRTLVSEVASQHEVHPRSMPLRLRRHDGGAQEVILSVTGTSLGAESRDAVIRIDV